MHVHTKCPTNSRLQGSFKLIYTPSANCESRRSLRTPPPPPLSPTGMGVLLLCYFEPGTGISITIHTAMSLKAASGKLSHTRLHRSPCALALSWRITTTGAADAAPSTFKKKNAFSDLKSSWIFKSYQNIISAFSHSGSAGQWGFISGLASTIFVIQKEKQFLMKLQVCKFPKKFFSFFPHGFNLLTLRSAALPGSSEHTNFWGATLPRVPAPASVLSPRRLIYLVSFSVSNVFDPVSLQQYCSTGTWRGTMLRSASLRGDVIA